jgi:hypothetical protein
MAERREYLGGGYVAAGREMDDLPGGSLRDQVEELKEQAREETVRLAADARAQVAALVRRRQELLADRLGGIAAALRDAGRRLQREAARPAGTRAAGAGAWPAAAGVGGPSMMPPLAAPALAPAPAKVDAATRGVCELAERAARQMDRAARYVRHSELRDVVRDFEELARRRPAVLVGGSFATGVLLARFLKSSGERGERTTWSGSDMASDLPSTPASRSGAAAGGGLVPEELPGRW